MFIYIEIVRTEYYQREKSENKKQLNKYDKIYIMKKENKRQKSTAPVFPGGHPYQY